MEFRNTREAFRHGLDPTGAPQGSGAILNNVDLFARIGHWQPSELVDSRDSAYRVGRAFRAAAYYLDQLAVPVKIGEDILHNGIEHMGKIHMMMHGGRHPFGPAHVAAAVQSALAETGPHPRFLVKAGKTSDDVYAAILNYARCDDDDLVPM